MKTKKKNHKLDMSESNLADAITEWLYSRALVDKDREIENFSIVNEKGVWVIRFKSVQIKQDEHYDVV